MTVLEFLPEKGKTTKVKCICDCGKEHIAQPMMIRRGTTTSCGCYRKEVSLYNRENDIIPLHFKPRGVAALNSFEKCYKDSAKRRNMEYKLSREQFSDITKKDCFYCGSAPIEQKFKCNYGGYIGNGIDRVENDKGYIVENCVPCCNICNRAKLNLNQDVFMNWINKLVGFKKTIEKDEVPKSLAV